VLRESVTPEPNISPQNNAHTQGRTVLH